MVPVITIFPHMIMFLFDFTTKHEREQTMIKIKENKKNLDKSYG